MKDQLRKFKEKTAQISEEKAKTIMLKGTGLTFEELEERDDLLTYSRLQREFSKKNILRMMNSCKCNNEESIKHTGSLSEYVEC
ncbi:MAG: hypothetical protein ACFFFG_07790 [Candidatus Thorarchaeota archaeon]